MPAFSASLRGVPWAAALLVLLAIAANWLQGFSVGADKVFPGPMNRHRDAMAIALTKTAYGEWHGYAAFRKVVRTLNDNGLSIHPEDVRHTGKANYFEVMRSPQLVDNALAKAASLENPGSEGLYLLNDEKGMAAFYVVAFSLFGHSLGAAFYAYALLLSISALIFFAAFWRRGEALAVLASVLLAHAGLIAVCQSLEPDVNSIHSGRFLPALSFIAVLHLAFLVLYRQRPTLVQVVLAVGQALLFAFVLNARGTAAWQAMLFFTVFAGVALHWLGGRLGLARGRGVVPPPLWPAGMLIAAIALQQWHVAAAYHPRYLDATGTVNHVIWHSLSTALVNNPKRGEVLGVDPSIPVWDDANVYALFKREIARRGETLDMYMVGDGNWRLRTSDPTYDFIWSKYDRVMREVFVRVAVAHPVFTFKSFAVYQTRDTIAVLLDVVRRHAAALLHPGVLALLAGAVWCLGSALRSSGWTMYWVLVAALPFAALSTYVSAVVPLRITDLFLAATSLFYFALAHALAGLVPSAFPARA